MRLINNIKEIILEASKKDVLINKFGLRDDIADGLYQLCGPLAVWMFNKLIEYQKYISYSYSDTSDPDKMSKEEVIDIFNSDSESRILNTWRSNIISVMDYIRVGLNGDISSIKDESFREIYLKSQEWHESLAVGGGDINYEEKNPVIIDFKNGYYWVNLGTNYSKEECDRMGHCGRTSSGNMLYSLRQNINLPGGKHKLNKSLLTAAISYNVMLYQLKGPKNSKPSPEYYIYIVPLLYYINPETNEYLINSFGKEYGHERDFKLSDLELEDLNMVFRDRPELFNPEDNDIILDISKEHPEILQTIYESQPEYFNPENSKIIIKEGKNVPELIKQIYSDNPEWFNTFRYQLLLSDLGIIDSKNINWNIQVTIDADDIDRYIDGGWTIGNRRISIFELILNGETWDLYETYDVDWKASLKYYVDEENEELIYNIIKKQAGDSEIDEDLDLSDLIEEYDENDEIIDALRRATESAESDSYVNHLDESLKSSLEDYGKILQIVDGSVTLEINMKSIINNLYDDEYFYDAMDRCDNDLKCTFGELVYEGSVDKPKFDIDDRWYPDINEKNFNYYLKDILHEIN